MLWCNDLCYFCVLLRVSEQRNILHEIRKWKANWIGHILRRNCLLQQVIEGKIKGQIEVTRRWGRRRKKLLDDLKDRRGYCQLKEEALDRTMWRNRFGRGFGPVVWQITDDDDDEWVRSSSIVMRLHGEDEDERQSQSKSQWIHNETRIKLPFIQFFVNRRPCFCLKHNNIQVHLKCIKIFNFYFTENKMHVHYRKFCSEKLSQCILIIIRNK